MDEPEIRKAITDEELERQIAAAEKFSAANPRKEPRAVAVGVAGQRLTIEFEAGWSFSFDPRVLPELKSAGSSGDLLDVKILGAGYTLEWTAFDVHLGTAGIVEAIIGDGFLRSLYASVNGKVKSAKRAAASAANGRLGGRPPTRPKGNE